MDDKQEMGRGMSRRKTASNLTFCVKKENDGKYRKVYAALQKKDDELGEEERQLIFHNPDLVSKARESLRKKEEVKARQKEVEDPDDVLILKCQELAAALRNSKHLVVYTGAGISTAAKIPDYRGSNGIWTLLQKGKDIGKHDLSRAEPTLTHMALFELYSQGILKYVVSQNCDGLHLRSGLPRSALSEVHGNMHLEICQTCRPCIQYWRMFDVTENTGRFSHRTMRRCHICHSALIDTIVHFGERGNLPWPLNWPAANKAADNADTILCIGSSLKVLKKYPWLWGMDKPVRKRPKLYIINLQWTPKDDHAVLKINGRCDKVMQEVMRCLNLKIPEYSRFKDPIFCHATHLHPDEVHTTSQPELDSPYKSEENDTKEIPLTEHRLKRISPSNETDSHLKVRKIDDAANMEFIVINDFYEILKEDGSKNSAIECKVKAEPADSDRNSIAFLACDSIDCNSSSVPSMGLKNCETAKNAAFVSNQNFSPTFFGELSISSKVKVESLSSDIDGKENVAVFSRDSGESAKCSKKADADKTFETLDGTEKFNKLQTIHNGLQSTNIESDVDCVALIKCQKSFMKTNCEVSEDEVGVLKMLQLEHNYSKTMEDNLNNLSSEVTETNRKEMKGSKQDVSKSDIKDPKCETNGRDTKERVQNALAVESKEERKDSTFISQETHKRSLRRTSRDAVNYYEDDDDDLEDDGEDDDVDDDDGIKMNSHQSVRSSKRVQERKNIKHSSKHNEKIGKNMDDKKNVEDIKRCGGFTNTTAKRAKPPTPLKNKKLTKADFEIRVELKALGCNFCFINYKSKTCLFYPSLDSRPRHFEGCICECCDYSADSEEDDNESNGEGNEGKGDSTDNAEEGPTKASVINPGWYGKGYRKRFRKKK